MGRSPCCDKSRVKRGSWSPEEDAILKSYLAKHGPTGNWISLPHKAGLSRCGKSCRLRWFNYLRPNIKHGGFTQEEEDTICNLYNRIGSRWSAIAAQLEGRTDNEVKNFWNTKLKKKKVMFKSKVEEETRAATKVTTTTTFEALPKLVPEGSSDFSSANSNCQFSPPLQELSSFSPFGFGMDGDDWISTDEGLWDYSDADVFRIFQC